MKANETGDNLAHRAQRRYQLPAGARQIIFVRHGASVGPTVDTVELDELTISDPELAPDGHIQAARRSQRAMRRIALPESSSARFAARIKPRLR